MVLFYHLVRQTVFSLDPIVLQPTTKYPTYLISPVHRRVANVAGFCYRNLAITCHFLLPHVQFFSGLRYSNGIQHFVVANLQEIQSFLGWAGDGAWSAVIIANCAL